MQLYDYIFWKTSQTSTNYWVTKIAMITNNIQPIFLAILIMIFGKTQLKPLSSILVILYVIATIFYSINAWKHIKYTVVTKQSYPSLHWQWNGQYGFIPYYGLYLLTMTALLYQHFERPINIVACILCITTFIFSSILYTKRGTTGRLWCWMTGLSPLIFVCTYTFIKYSK